MIARDFTPKVFVKKWEGYGEGKNYGLQLATSDWVLWLDADERVSDALCSEIKSTIEVNVGGYDAYSIPRKAFFLGKWIKHCGWYPGRVIRLFRREKVRFNTEKVHETVTIFGTTGQLKQDLLHYTDRDLDHYYQKFNHYTTLAAEERILRRNHFSLFALLLNPVWTFLRMYVVKRGFLDGMHGFILSVLSAHYVFAKYAKVWEIESRQKKENQL